MRKVLLLVIVLLFSLATICNCQPHRRGGKKPQGNQGNQGLGILDNIINIIFPGPADQSIFTKIMNKIGYYVSPIVGLIFGYFTFFRKNKKRNQKIINFLSEWKEKIITLKVQDEIEASDKKCADTTFHQFNFILEKPENNSNKEIRINLKSHNNKNNFNIQITKIETSQDSSNMYSISMTGTDPEGNSTLEGFTSVKNGKIQLAMAQTHAKHQNKEESPVCYFEGKQQDQKVKTIEGDWWMEGQKGTQGEYSGIWKFQF